MNVGRIPLPLFWKGLCSIWEEQFHQSCTFGVPDGWIWSCIVALPDSNHAWYEIDLVPHLYPLDKGHPAVKIPGPPGIMDNPNLHCKCYFTTFYPDSFTDNAGDISQTARQQRRYPCNNNILLLLLNLTVYLIGATCKQLLFNLCRQYMIRWPSSWLPTRLLLKRLVPVTSMESRRLWLDTV